MQITCWGTRGSIPVTGPNFTLYGGDTLCIQVTSRTGNTVIVDTGSGVQHINKNLAKNTTNLSIIYTHYHFDHVLGLSTLNCLFNKECSIDFYGPLADCRNSLEKTLKTLISGPFSPFTLTDTSIVKAQLSYTDITRELTPFTIGSLTITPILVHHSNCGTLGYKIEEDGKSFVLLADNELDSCSEEHYQKLINFSQEADLIFLDSQFTAKEYASHKNWGHSSIECAIDFAKEADVKTCGFLHYDPKRTDEEITRLYTGLSTEKTNFTPLKQGQTFQL